MQIWRLEWTSFDDTHKHNVEWFLNRDDMITRKRELRKTRPGFVFQILSLNVPLDERIVGWLNNWADGR